MTELKRIDSLTNVQRGRFQEWIDKWISIGLNTDPADFERFERAARQCYRVWIRSMACSCSGIPIGMQSRWTGRIS